ncbi:beige protein-like 1 [Pleurotus ostreatus]|nr:beige protein-like 1 [Pleurotus ostreatus]
MFRTLLTPLRSRFEPSPAVLPSEEGNDDDVSPEDFARDVLIQLMRNSIESLKLAENEAAQVQSLAEIHGIMLQNSCTKDVFRELDGFLFLIKTLSTTQLQSNGPVVEPEDQLVERAIQTARLVFAILRDAMQDHPGNTSYFRVSVKDYHLRNSLRYAQTSVGFDSLAQSLSSLVSNGKTRPDVLGLVLSLLLQDASFSESFLKLAPSDDGQLDIQVAEVCSRIGPIRHPGAVNILWDTLPRIPVEDHSSRMVFFKVFEQLCRFSHRNQAVLSASGIIKPLLGYYYGSRTGISARERQVVSKLLKKLLDMGATTPEARFIFQRAVKGDDSLDVDILEPIRSGMKSRWPEHFSMESTSSICLSGVNTKALASGCSIMMWVWIESLPATAYPLVRLRPSLGLYLRPDGKFESQLGILSTPWVVDSAPITKSRWTHFVVTYHSQRSHCSLKFFIDGALIDTLKLIQPLALEGVQAFEIGSVENHTGMSWCMASTYLVGGSIADEHPRLIHHLGPRYTGNLQDSDLVKFLTYEASTSLTMFMSNVASKAGASSEQLSLLKAIKDGLALPESSILLSLSAGSVPQSGFIGTLEVPRHGDDGHQKLQELSVNGDVYVVKAACLDEALWRLGGAPVAMRLVQLAKSPHELSRSLGILVDGLRNSWKNSENMERMRGYEILADILRQKSQFINMTSFETLFEFLGVNFKTPDQSTVVNPIAYRAIALDFELWSRTKDEIQREYFAHFTTLLQTSRYRRFNSKQRFVKMGLVRKLLFAVQTDWYCRDDLPHLIDALRVVAEANFTKDEAIKPIVSYLAANLHEGAFTVTTVASRARRRLLDPIGQPDSPSSPLSIVSRLDQTGGREKAEHVFAALLSILSSPTSYTRFAVSLPHTRIPLLLLGDRPSPFIATRVLALISMSLQASPTFSRKFELISGWNVLKAVLPRAWDRNVNEAAFGILLGRGSTNANAGGNVVVCPQIVPAILCALKEGLESMSKALEMAADQAPPSSSESVIELLIEELMNLHASSSTFRQIFKSQQTTQLFVDAYKAYVSRITALPALNSKTTSTVEKLNHLGLAFALDNSVAGSQKRQILDTMQMAEASINPDAERTAIDPSLVADVRSVRQRIASARLSMQVGERTIMKTVARMQEWRKTIQTSERKRLRKDVLDLREHRRQISRLGDWALLLESERGLWPHCDDRLWRLDETEGPQRIRKKMEPQDDKTWSSRLESYDHLRDVTMPESETSSQIQVEVPPWAESYEISATEMEDRQLAEDIADDKHRRVRHELEPGDVIEAVATVARIAGVDSSPGLLIIGKTHVYMLDGVVENDDGEVIDAHDAPRHLFSVPGSIVELDGPQRAQRWSHDQIASFSDKTFLFRDVALEIYFKDSRSLLVVFLHKERRSDTYHRLSTIISRTTLEVSTPGIGSALLKSPLLGRVSSRVLSGLKIDEISTAQRKWQAREISNFTYLSILNQLSGRTPSDATQYPVFPWVLQDYTSTSLNLNSPEVYRDLTKPMGALTPARCEAAAARYSNLESVDEKPFHYGTHFSSSMIVCHFLIRMAPFTNMFKTLQGGDWDLPDRLFSDIGRAYESAARDVRGDVRELIPEFYTCPEFLENSANLDFGIQQGTGERIHDVKLPPWAKRDPLLFIILSRRALESDQVSENLPAWIDLIWGCKQRDPDALNVFHPLSYEGSIDLESITDELEREATVGIIHNFGQTPRKLFTIPHPPRYHHGLSTLPLGTLHGIEEDPFLLSQANRCFRDLGSAVPVRELVLDNIGERVLPYPEGVLSFPHHPHEQIEWGPSRTTGGALRAVVDHKVTQVIEGAYCTCASFADANCLVTGSSDYTVRLWKITRGAQIKTTTPAINGRERNLQITLSHIMRIHTEEVICVTASRSWSAVLSGSKDGSAVLWDLNRGMYVRTIWHGHSEEDSVHLVAINESTGYVATCSRLRLCLHTINGRPMATLDLTRLSSYSRLVPTITSMAFHEREYSHLGILAIGSSDGAISLLTWTADGTPVGEKAQWEFLTIRTMKVRMSGKANRLPAVTALKFVGESLAHGEETGKSFMWSLPD